MALNVVLAGKWKPLDIRWNQGSHVFRYRGWKRSPFDRRTYEQLRRDPFIVHFTTSFKPWLLLCRHPLRGEFFRYLDRTAWAGWRLSRYQELRAIVRQIRLSIKRRLNLHRARRFDAQRPI